MVIEEKRGGVIKALVAAALLAVVLCVVLLSSVPPVSRDALVHHLALPKLFLKHGVLAEFPTMDYSYYPMNLDLLYMIPLWLGNDIAPKWIHFAFALLTAWVLFSYLKSRLGGVYGLLGALFFLSTPVIVKLSTTVYVDLGVIFFSTASMLLLLRWAERGFRLRFLILSGICCGLALGTKYNALVAFFLLVLLAVFLRGRSDALSKRPFFKAVGAGLLFFFVAVVLFSPWMIRNYSLKGNPVHPLFKAWFAGKKAVVDRDAQAPRKVSSRRYGFFVFRKVVYGESGWDMALLPLRIFFEGQDGDPRRFDGRLNPFLLILSLCAFLGGAGRQGLLRREARLFLLYSVLFFTIALFTSPLRIRYISPIIPPLVILSVIGVKNLVGWGRAQGPGWVRGFSPALSGILCGGMVLLNAGYMKAQFSIVKPFSYLAGKVNRDQYIARRIPEYGAMKVLNAKTPQDAKVLFLFVGKRGYYCDRDYVLFRGAFKRAFLKGDSAQGICRDLREMGVSHLLLSVPLLNRWVGDNFQGERRKSIHDFFGKYVQGLYCGKGFCVVALRCKT